VDNLLEDLDRGTLAAMEVVGVLTELGGVAR
jgi:hypothetical protein